VQGHTESRLQKDHVRDMEEALAGKRGRNSMN